MNIVVLSGSPRRGANTDTMVDAFAETAREGGHTVEVIRVSSKKIGGCLGCQYCFALYYMISELWGRRRMG